MFAGPHPLPLPAEPAGCTVGVFDAVITTEVDASFSRIRAAAAVPSDDMLSPSAWSEKLIRAETQQQRVTTHSERCVNMLEQILFSVRNLEQRVPSVFTVLCPRCAI